MEEWLVLCVDPEGSCRGEIRPVPITLGLAQGIKRSIVDPYMVFFIFLIFFLWELGVDFPNH